MKILKFEVKFDVAFCAEVCTSPSLWASSSKFVKYDGVRACVPMHQISVAQ